MAQLVRERTTSSTATLKVVPEELANVIKSLCLDAQVYEFRISITVEGGRDLFLIGFDHTTSLDFGNFQSYQLTELNRRGLLAQK